MSPAKDDALVAAASDLIALWGPLLVQQASRVSGVPCCTSLQDVVILAISVSAELVERILKATPETYREELRRHAEEAARLAYDFSEATR